MKINRIYIDNFGGISEKEFILDSGLNVIFGNNESGKSTFLSFIRFVFYGAKKSNTKKLSFFQKYMPWNGKDMGGEIEFCADGNDYSLSRYISSSGRKKQVTFINKTTGDEIAVNEKDIGTYIFKMSEEAFLKTLFIDAEGALISADGELLTKISNVSQSGDEKISYQSVMNEINSMIADLSSTRKTHALIPDLEKKIASLKSSLEDAETRYAQKSESAQSLKIIDEKLQNSLRKKGELERQLRQAKQYEDFMSYKNLMSQLKEAEDAYKSIDNGSGKADSKYDFLNDITADEEQILLKDNSDEISSSKMREVLLRDKIKSSKNFSIISFILSLLSVAGAIFLPALFILTVVMVISGVYFAITSKGKEKELASVLSKIENIESEKTRILKKYNLESSENYKILKREFADAKARTDLQNANINMAKGVFERYKSEFDAFEKSLITKYGTTDIECEKPTYDEPAILSSIKSVDNEILHFSEESGKMKNDAAAVDGVAQEIALISEEIRYCKSGLDEANEKLRILNLAADILNDSYEELKTNFAPRLAKSTANIFGALTGGKYGELIVNDSFGIQIKKDGKYENSEFFSSGTIQQLYFSLRLGIIELIMGNYPLFLDDAFITYDDERFAYASDFLNNYSADNQIIFCTCHKRESAMQCAKTLKF